MFLLCFLCSFQSLYRNQEAARPGGHDSTDGAGLQGGKVLVEAGGGGRPRCWHKCTVTTDRRR